MTTDTLPREHSRDNAAASEDSGAEQLAMLRESAAKFCAPDTHVPRSRALRATRPGYDRKVWSDIAELGWLGILVPERFGGLGLGPAEMAAVCEAAGRALLPEPIVPASVLATACVLHGDNDALKAALLPAFVAGGIVPALGWREAGHETDILAVNATATHGGGTVRLAGTKRLVFTGGADGYIVSARAADRISLYWVPAELCGERVSVYEIADGRSAVDLELDGLEVPEGNRVAGPASAQPALTRAYDDALIATSAELLGVLSRAFEITLDYLRTRVQFGKLIGSYQALQHRAVDLYAAQFMSRCTLNEVLEKLAKGNLSPSERGAQASRVKARCAETSLRVTREAIQMHGAMGFSDECDVGLYLKRAITLSAWLGGADFHRRRYAALASQEQEVEA